MSVYEVTATSETNKKTFRLDNGDNILGRTHPDLGLRTNLKLSRKQVCVTVDVSARRTTIERLGSNTSKLNARDLPLNQIVELANNDRITLVIDQCGVVFHIRDTPIPSSVRKKRRREGTSEESGSGEEGGMVLEEGGTSDEGEGPAGTVFPEEFSDESPDVVGSGVDSDDEPSDNEKPAPPPQPTTSPTSSKIKAEPTSSSPVRASQKRTKPTARKSRNDSEQRDRALPKRRMTAYGLFSTTVRSQLKKDYPKYDQRSITRLVKRRFEELSKEERKEYERRVREHNKAIRDEEGGDEEDGEDGDGEEEEEGDGRSRRHDGDAGDVAKEEGEEEEGERQGSAVRLLMSDGNDEEEEEEEVPLRRHRPPVLSMMEVEEEGDQGRESDGSRTSVDDVGGGDAEAGTDGGEGGGGNGGGKEESGDEDAGVGLGVAGMWSEVGGDGTSSPVGRGRGWPDMVETGEVGSEDVRGFVVDQMDVDDVVGGSLGLGKRGPEKGSIAGSNVPASTRPPKGVITTSMTTAATTSTKGPSRIKKKQDMMRLFDLGSSSE
ncbi:hypothetical protein HDV00_004986 [Rhizophlyctis rosea]|nr:hypothetical protein HDV00_004986 [Rhizophlyctis rosea]